MKVSGIFKTLIVVVICIIIGAFAINVLAPNVVNQVSNAIEASIFKATGMQFDFNADGTTAQDNQSIGDSQREDSKGDVTGDTENVGGFSNTQ